MGAAPENMKDLFLDNWNSMNLENETSLSQVVSAFIDMRTETASFVGPRIWSSILRKHKECS